MPRCKTLSTCLGEACLRRGSDSKIPGIKKLDQMLCVVSTGVASSWEAIYDNAVGFLEAQGRMKFVRPLYRNLYRTGAALPGTTRHIDRFRKKIQKRRRFCTHPRLLQEKEEEEGFASFLVENDAAFAKTS